MLRKDLSIILPAHNEELNIVRVVETLEKALRKTNITYEIICVENGSTDNTLLILKQLAKKNAKVSVVQSSAGWGNAVRTGFMHARGNYICYSVSDGQVDLSIIPQLYLMSEGKQHVLVKVVRVARENYIRKINSSVFNFLAYLLFGIDCHDINATPKLFKRDAISSLAFISSNVSFDLELLLTLVKRNFTIVEVPIKTNKRKSGVSSTTIMTAFEMVKYMVYFRFRYMQPSKNIVI